MGKLRSRTTHIALANDQPESISFARPVMSKSVKGLGKRNMGEAKKHTAIFSDPVGMAQDFQSQPILTYWALLPEKYQYGSSVADNGPINGDDMETVADRISDHARDFQDWAKNPDRFLESCDGGDTGTPANPSIWVMGIEPGWSLADQEKEASGQKISPETLAEYSIDLQLGWPFNVAAFKLLAALDERSPADYLAFAQEKRPFERGCTGYFKANLFPEAFYNIPAWGDEAIRTTGFATKAEYQMWMRAARFPILTSWIEKCRPKLIIGLGLTHADDFLAIVQAPEQPEQHSFEVNGHSKRMLMSQSGLVPLAILPHLTGGPNGLNSNEAIAYAAQQIRSHLSIE